MSSINEVQYEHIGFAGTESINFKNFIELKKTATIFDLLQLSNNQNSVVACYSGWALADKSYSDLKSIFANFISQKKQVETFNGCIRSQNNLSSELYHRYWNSIDDNKKTTDKILLQLDSVILFSKSADWLLTIRALENRVYKEPFKSQIEKLAFHQGNIDAIYYFCNWHRAEYADQIKAGLVTYLKNTNFEKIGTTEYYKTLQELFKFKDPNIEKIIIAKLKKDRNWEKDKERFKYLLEDNYIYNIDME